MINKYSYKGQDITLDSIMKIEKVVRIVCERTGKTFDNFDIHMIEVYIFNF